jgi:hypothetical protein
MLKKIKSRLYETRNWYYVYNRKIKLYENIHISNKELYRELEQECKKRAGILTYAEFLTIEQFGMYGFYATSNYHGLTDVESRWADALAYYCQDFGHDTIIEFGCGTGDLGVAAAKKYKKLTNKSLNWIGVELDKGIHDIIFTNFKKNNLQNSVEKIVSSLVEIPDKKNALIVFPYSLDNIPPQIFLNTKTSTSYPDALLGIKVENGRLSEVIIPQNILDKKQIKFENGIFTQNNLSFKLSGWKLRKGQRAYISTDAYAVLYNYAKKFEDATMIIIDEFSKEPSVFDMGYLGTPKSLYEKNLKLNELTRYYRESGKHNLYYPLYKDTILKFLSTIGFRSCDYDIEQKIAATISGKKWFPIAKSYSTYAFFAKHFIDKKQKILTIPSPPKRIL